MRNNTNGRFEKTPRTAPVPEDVEGCVWIAATQGQFALVDEEDADLASFAWFANRCGKSNAEASFYVFRAGHVGAKKTRNVSLHRNIADRMGLDLSKQIDHKNGNPLDNRRCNLREATSTENRRNTKMSPRNTSGHRGVRWNASRQKWQSFICVNRKNIYLGQFTDIKDAALAYDAAADRIFGEFKRKPENDNNT